MALPKKVWKKSRFEKAIGNLNSDGMFWWSQNIDLEKTPPYIRVSHKLFKNLDIVAQPQLDSMPIDIATAREGDPCPLTGQPLQLKRGIEVGNIFKLGTKYSAAMNCNFLDQNGKSQPMIMYCSRVFIAFLNITGTHL
jgi:hypothetical protein